MSLILDIPYKKVAELQAIEGNDHAVFLPASYVTAQKIYRSVVVLSSQRRECLEKAYHRHHWQKRLVSLAPHCSPQPRKRSLCSA